MNSNIFVIVILSMSVVYIISYSFLYPEVKKPQTWEEWKVDTIEYKNISNYTVSNLKNPQISQAFYGYLLSYELDDSIIFKLSYDGILWREEHIWDLNVTVSGHYILYTPAMYYMAFLSQRDTGYKVNTAVSYNGTYWHMINETNITAKALSLTQGKSKEFILTYTSLNGINIAKSYNMASWERIGSIPGNWDNPHLMILKNGTYLLLFTDDKRIYISISDELKDWSPPLPVLSSPLRYASLETKDGIIIFNDMGIHLLTLPNKLNILMSQPFMFPSALVTEENRIIVVHESVSKDIVGINSAHVSIYMVQKHTPAPINWYLLPPFLIFFLLLTGMISREI